MREDAARDGCIYLPQNDNQAINKAINAPSKLQVHKLTARGLKNGSFRRNIKNVALSLSINDGSVDQIIVE